MANEPEKPKEKAKDGSWNRTSRFKLWQPTKKVVVACPGCANKFELAPDELKHLMKHLLMGDMAEDYDAPIREILYGALDKNGARAIGREIRRQIASKVATPSTKQRAMEILAGLMKHHEKMHPPQLDTASMSSEQLEREIDRRLGIKNETPAGDDAGEPPAWFKKVAGDESVAPAETGESDHE